MTRQQIHGDRDFDRPRNRPYPASPSLRRQYHAPVSYRAIRGAYRVSIQLEAPVLVWGRDGECWCFIHDLDPRALACIMADFREAAYDRRGEFGRPFGVDR